MTKVLTVLLAIIGVVVLALALGAAIILLAWNVGVVGIAAALGATVAKIGFWTALGVSFLLNVIGGVFRRGEVTASS